MKMKEVYQAYHAGRNGYARHYRRHMGAQWFAYGAGEFFAAGDIRSAGVFMQNARRQASRGIF